MFKVSRKVSTGSNQTLKWFYHIKSMEEILENVKKQYCFSKGTTCETQRLEQKETVNI